MKSLPHHLNRSRQGGVALIASLIIMLLMTIVALSVYRNNILIEKMTGDTREKQRALQAANDALQYAEWWIRTSSVAKLTPAACNTTAGGTTPVLQVCTKAAPRTAASITNLQMYDGYVPAGMNVLAGGGTLANGDVYYTRGPAIWISTIPGQYFGSNLGQTLYQVTAVGYGGNVGTQAVVQSIFTIPLSASGGSAGATSGNNLGGA